MGTFPAFLARRGGARATTWWAKAWLRALEEAAYDESDLRAGRTLSRSGRIGRITVEPGRFLASGSDHQTWFTVTGEVPVLDDPAREAFVELVAAEAGRVAALTAGELPHDLVEQAEEAGVELLPFGSELSTECTCEAWVDPCAHALAVGHQVAWLVDADPFVLLLLRGLSRDDLLARLHAHQSREATGDDPDLAADLAAALDAALRARRVLDLLDDGDLDALDRLL